MKTIVRMQAALLVFAIAFAGGCKKEDVEKAEQAAKKSADSAAEALKAGAEKAKEAAGDAGKVINEKAQVAGEKAKDLVNAAQQKANELAPKVTEWAKAGNEKLSALGEKLKSMNLSIPQLTGDKSSDKSALEGFLAAINAQLEGLKKASSGLSIGNVQIPGADAKAIEQKRASLEDAAKSVQPILEQMKGQ